VFGFGPKAITTDQLAERLRDGAPILLDVREPDEFAGGHVPGARNVPMAKLPEDAAHLDPEAEVLLICQSGRRSATAARHLASVGFTDVHSVKGGTSAWHGRLER
jgi:rhodanese-related sulfurtransferase